MNIYYIPIFLLCLLLLSCKEKDIKNEYVFNSEVSLIIDSFLVENPNKDLYELYIDKTDPHNAILTLFAGKKSITLKENEYQKQKPLIQIVNKGVNINIYSGAERYISQNIKKLEFQHKDDKRIIDNVCWIIKDSFNILTVIKHPQSQIYPFLPLPIKIDKDKLTRPIIED